MNKMESGTSRHLVVGLGEVGSAVKEVFNADGYDRDKRIYDYQLKQYDFFHVCVPYKDFKQFSWAIESMHMDHGKHDTIIIIHSTVPIGTTEKIQNAVHSPVRGVHPDLAPSIRTFVKFIGGERAEEVKEEFEKFGLRCITTPNARNTEAMKLWSTTQHGLAILLEKFIHAFCKRLGLDFYIVYTQANKTYNEGYAKMGKPQFCRPVLEQVDGKIGGHCIVPNAKLLNNPLAKWLIKTNKRIKS